MSTIDPDSGASTPGGAHAGNAAAPTEKKVTAATGATAAAVALLTSILALTENDQLIEGMPDWVPVLLSVLIAAGSAFGAGRSAPHTARPDLPRSQR